MTDYKPVALGYVRKNNGDNEEILIATRISESDRLGTCQYVLPGGSLEPGETYIQAAVREVLEETGIFTDSDSASKINGHELLVRNDFIEAQIEEGGDVYVTYLDSKRSYRIQVISLQPLDSARRPDEQEHSDARDPRYESLSRIYDPGFVAQFTPACQVCIELIKQYEMSKNFSQ